MLQDVRCYLCILYIWVGVWKQQCHRVSHSVTQCHIVSHSVLQCHRMSDDATKMSHSIRCYLCIDELMCESSSSSTQAWPHPEDPVQPPPFLRYSAHGKIMVKVNGKGKGQKVTQEGKIQCNIHLLDLKLKNWPICVKKTSMECRPVKIITRSLLMLMTKIIIDNDKNDHKGCSTDLPQLLDQEPWQD